MNALVSEINLARSDAVTRNTWVTLKPLSGSEWHKGWQTFADGDHDGVFDEADSELRQHESLTSSVTIDYSVAGITFLPTGSLMVSASSPASGPGTFTFCDVRGWQKARGIVLSSNGRLRVARDINADKYPEDDAGNHLTRP